MLAPSNTAAAKCHALSQAGAAVDAPGCVDPYPPHWLRTFTPPELTSSEPKPLQPQKPQPALLPIERSTLSPQLAGATRNQPVIASGAPPDGICAALVTL